MARHTVTTAALAATAALLLTACGGGDDRSPDDIKGADTGPNDSPSAAASTSPSADHPTVTLPKNFRLTFEKWTSSDPETQALLTDAKEQLRAGYAAIIANEADGGEALAFYDTEPGLSQDRQWIKTYTGENLTVFGELPAFDPEVSFAGNKKAASLTYCTDESKAYSKNRRTGEVAGNPAGEDPRIFYTVSLAKNAQGVWQNLSTRSERGACS